MKVVDFVKQMNKKQQVKAQRVMELKKYYISMYRVYMVKLYDSGYVSDPTTFDEMQMYSNIIDMGIKGMFDISGNINLSSEYALYALHKCNKDFQGKEFLENLYQALRYREYCGEIDDFYEEYKFSNNCRQKISINLKSAGCRVSSKSGIAFTRGSLACFVDSKHTVKSLNINDKLWSVAMKELGIPVEDWYADGLFDKDLSHSQEVESIKLLLDGHVNLTGSYSKVLTDWLYEHKWLDHGMSNTRKGLYSYLFVKYCDDVFELESELLNSLQDSGKRIIAMLDTDIFIEEPIHTLKVPIGCFSVVCSEEDDLLFDGAILDGYTGEAYPEGYLVEEGITFVGCPFELNINTKDKGIFYDLEQVDVHSDTWFKTEDIVLYFEGNRPKYNNPYPEDSLENKLYNICKQSIIGDLIGNIPYNFEPNELNSAKKAVMKIL